MQVSLKKAFEYEQAAFAAAGKISLTGAINVSIYGRLPVSNLLEEASSASKQNASDIIDLVSAGNHLHRLRSDINAQVGINSLLTQQAGLKNLEGHLNSIINKLTPTSTSRRGFSEAVIITDPFEAVERIADAKRKKDNESTYSGVIPESVTVSVFDKNSLREYIDMLDDVRYKIQDIKDQLTALNLNSRVEVPQEVADTLRKHKIIK